MRRILFALALLFLIFPKVSISQCSQGPRYNNVSTIKFSGVAPQPWGINGRTDDWETILGPYTGNNFAPYNKSAGLNYSFELSDADTPDPIADIRFMSFTYDDYNVYFYLRKLKNSSTNFFYFFDVNADGFMSNGEPVLGGKTLPGNSNSNNNELALYRYIPVQVADPLGNPFVDGYTMPGSTQKIFDNHEIPADFALRPNEIFSLRPTENGYGVEFAIPWRYLGLLPGLIFTYHISLQKSLPPGQEQQTGYQPALVEDNAGSCCKKLLFSGLPEYNITNTSIKPLGNLRYQMLVTIQNLKNVRLGLVLNEIFFTNIQLNTGIPFSRDDFSVTVNGQNPPYRYGSISQQPIRYSYSSYENFLDIDFRPGFEVDAFSTTTITIYFTLPANRSVSKLSVGASFSNAFFPYTGNYFLSLPSLIYCTQSNIGDAPVGNRPVILEVTTENKKKPTNNLSEINTQANSALKVFPNPSNGIATVIIPGDGLKGELRLEDVSGKLIYRKINTTGSTVTLPILKSGFYLLRFIDKDTGKQYIEKLVVQ